MAKINFKSNIFYILVFLYAFFNVGCVLFTSNLVKVAPYEKDYIVDPIMAFDEEFSEEQNLIFVYFSDFESTWYVGAGSAGGCST
jgi:hypothetical protein